MRAAGANPWILLGGSIASLIATHMIDYETQYPLKMLAYTGFIGCTALSILPLIQMSAASVIVATGEANDSDFQEHETAVPRSLGGRPFH